MISLLTLVNSDTSGVPNYPNINRGATIGLLGRFNSISGLLTGTSGIGNTLRGGVSRGTRRVHFSRFLTAVGYSIPCRFIRRRLIISRPSVRTLVNCFSRLRFHRRLTGLRTNSLSITGAAISSEGSNRKPALFSSISSTISIRPMTGIIMGETDVDDIRRRCGLISGSSRVSNLVTLLKRRAVFYFSARAASISTVRTRLIKVSFTIGDHRTCCIPIPTSHSTTVTLITQFGRLFRGTKVRGAKRGVGCSVGILTSCNIRIHKHVFSAVITRCLLRPRLHRNVSCLTRICLGCRAVRVRRLVNPDNGGRLSVHSITIRHITSCTTRSTSVALRLERCFRPHLTSRSLGSLFRSIRVPLITILTHVRHAKMIISRFTLTRSRRVLGRRVHIVRHSVRAVTNSTVGISSPHRINRLLFSRLGLISGPHHAGAKRCMASRRALRSLHNGRRVINGVLSCHSLHGLLNACVRTLPGLVGLRAKQIRASFGRAIATANHLSSSGPGLRGVPVHSSGDHRVHHTFTTPRKCEFVSTSCSRIRLHVVTRLSNSGTVIRTFGTSRSVRTTATTGVCRISVGSIASRVHQGTGATGFNVVCNVSTFKLSRHLNVSHNRTGSLVSNCFTSFPRVRSCVAGAIRLTQRQNCIRATLRHHHCLPSLASHGTGIHGCTRHGTIGSPVRNLTTSVVGVTVIHVTGHVRTRNLQSRVILRIRSRLGFVIPASRVSQVTTLIHARVRKTCALAIPLGIRVNINTG